MATGWEQFSDAIRQAIDNALKDSESLLAQLSPNINVTGSSGSNTGTPDLIGDILGLLGIGLALNPELLLAKDIVEKAQGDGGSSGALFGSGWFVGETLLQFAEPYTRMITHEVENLAQSQIYDPQQAADLVAHRFIDIQSGEGEAAGGGFDKGHFDTMVQASYSWPSTDVINRLWNRGEINDAEADTLYQRAGVSPDWTGPIKALRQEILTPPDLALAALRQTISMDDAIAGAAQWGLSADDFNTVLYNTGEPLSPQELNMALRRGFIDQDRYSQGIRESRIRDDWIPTALALRYFPMSVAQAANGVTRGYITEAQGAAIAQQNGLEASDWPVVLESNGRPLSHEQLATLYYRGEIDEATWKQGIRESDVKDKYIDDAVLLGVKLLPLFEGVSLLKNGDITGATFSKQMLDQGYQKEVIDEIVAAFGPGKATSSKHLTAAEIAEMYTDGALDNASASKQLVALGYTKDDADSVLTIADLKQQARAIGKGTTQVETQYFKNEITLDTAKILLKAIGVPDESVTRLTNLWSLTKPASSRNLTEAQVLGLLRKDKIDKPEAERRLMALGLDQTSADLLISEVK